MNPTKQEIAFSLFHTIRPRLANSEVISLDNIKFDIDNVRELLIRNEQNKNRTVDTNIIQDLGCVELEAIDRAECCDIELGCTFLRSKLQLPTPIELHHSQLITRVGPIDKIAPPFDRVSYDSVHLAFLNKFTKNKPKWFTKDNDNYLYVVLDKDAKNKFIKSVNVAGVWSDPETVRNFRTCEGKPCYTDNSSYPVKAWMVNYIKSYILEKYLGREAVAAMDDSGDFKNNPVQINEKR